MTERALPSQSEREITLWECPECGWVGYSVDGHCRQFDEHPDGPRIPLVPGEWVRKATDA